MIRAVQPLRRIAFALLLAGFVGSYLVPVGGAFAQHLPSGPATQDASLSDTSPEHRYSGIIRWEASGTIFSKDGEGCGHQEGQIFRCDDGAFVYVVTDQCTSAAAAEAKRQTRLHPNDRTQPGWHVARALPVDGGVLVELAEPVQLASSEYDAVRWILVWTQGACAMMI